MKLLSTFAFIRLLQSAANNHCQQAKNLPVALRRSRSMQSTHLELVWLCGAVTGTFLLHLHSLLFNDRKHFIYIMLLLIYILDY